MVSFTKIDIRDLISEEKGRKEGRKGNERRKEGRDAKGRKEGREVKGRGIDGWTRQGKLHSTNSQD